MQLLGCDLISTTEAIDTTTAIGRMFFVVCAAIAECESDKTSERVKIGMERAAAEGKVCNRPRVELSEYQIKKARRILAENPGISGRALAGQFEGIDRKTLIDRLKELGVVV